MSDLTTIVHLLRHGEVHNPEGVLYGRRDGFHLSDLGNKMAERVADGDRRPRHRPPRTSPLERAQETAAPLAAARGLTPVIDPRVIESTNKFEGDQLRRGRADVPEAPGLLRHMYNPFKPSWGEPYDEIAARMMAASRTPATPRAATRRSSSPTSCRSGRRGCFLEKRSLPPPPRRTASARCAR